MNKKIKKILRTGGCMLLAFLMLFSCIACSNGNQGGGETEPPATEPPATEPPATESPATEPLPLIPPVTSPVIPPVTGMLWKRTDTDPYTGTATKTNGACLVNGEKNSIVCEMGVKSKINRAVLHGINERAHVTGSVVALYASDDNKTYRLIPEFCMLQKGTDLHFFNFEVEAKYLKVHFSYISSSELELASYKSLENAVTVSYSEGVLLDGGTAFAGAAIVTVKNETAVAVRNKIVSYTLEDLGIPASALKADLSDIRFRTAGYELPHYYANGRFFVRVMNVPANGSVDVTVLYGNANAENVSNGMATLEIEYGTKYSTGRPAGEGVAWRNSVATMPDASLLCMGRYLKNENGDGDRDDPGERALSWERPTDGGHTWTKTQKIPGTSTADALPLTDGGGFVVDYKNNVVFYLAYENSNSYILKSTDSGYNWTNLGQVTTGAITYSDGITLSTADGAGPNVDYVFPMFKNKPSGDEFLWKAYASSLYSADGGATWVLSETFLMTGEYPKDNNGNTNDYWTQHESGMTESTIWEKKDGTLIMYSRYQGHLNGTNDVNHFLVSYSYDHGVTWKDTKVSTVRTTETQPVIEAYDGAPMLLWGGNNMLGFRSYARFPLNVAVSADDAEHFIGILDITHGTALASREDHRKTNEANINITNPDIAVTTYQGVEFAYIVTEMHFLVLENFRDFLYLTKGAFDSFESNDLESEGWMAISGTKLNYWDENSHPNAYHPGVAPTIGTTGATEGKYAMQLGSETEISRSVPYLTNGEIFFDFYASNLSGGYTLELQSSYTNNYHGNAAKVSPMRLRIDAQGDVCYYGDVGYIVDTGLNVKKNASNSISISFNAEEGTATVTVNGATKNIAFNAAAGAYVCFVHMRNGANSSVSIDRFGVVDYD